METNSKLASGIDDRTTKVARVVKGSSILNEEKVKTFLLITFVYLAIKAVQRVSLGFPVSSILFY